jgi:hypothetical protein
MPNALTSQLAEANLVLVKGDANYRRLHGDLHWDYTTPTSAIIDYFPAPLVALRTLKSGVQSGLEQTKLKELEQEPGWLTTGKYGVIQFVSNRK